MQIGLGEVKFSSEFQCQFPLDSCPNCGATNNLQPTVQITKKITGYFLFAGTEVTLDFPVSVCGKCLPTLKRNPLNISHKVVISLLFMAFIYLLLLPVFVVNKLTPLFIENNLELSAFFLGVVLPWLWFSMRSPSSPQTSFYQPIRILKLKRRFGDGGIESMTLGFTNKCFFQSFLTLNQEAIKRGVVRGILVS